MSKRAIRKALNRVNEEIAGQTRGGGMDGGGPNYSVGLSREGWQGGYATALDDVLLMLNHVVPTTRNYWRDTEPKPERDT